MRFSSILITGGAGFIGSHLIRRFVLKHPGCQVVNLDKLTYAGNLHNLADIERQPNYEFSRGDIVDSEFVESLFSKYNFQAVIHLAAESHVDRSIVDPLAFVRTNVLGTCTLLQVAKKHWQEQYESRCFYHVSTDEVYGSLGETGQFTEDTPYDPRSPYSASKASSDHFVRAFHETYGLPIKISNCSNNYGPNQFPEKLIPLCIQKMVEQKPVPVYGQGLNVRDWLFVEDHVEAIEKILYEGRVGETYNVGGDCEVRNIDIVRQLAKVVDRELGRAEGTSESLITFVQDRAGHDFRYAVDFGKLKKQLGWTPTVDLTRGLKKTVQWYLANQDWVQAISDGSYLKRNLAQSSEAKV
jgi:dTDP-glucose 4,6-dehydratase